MTGTTKGLDLSMVYMHGDSTPFTVCLPVQLIANEWVTALNDPEVGRLLWLPVLLNEEENPTVEPALLDLRQAVAVHSTVPEPDTDPLDLAEIVAKARESRPDLFPNQDPIEDDGIPRRSIRIAARVGGGLRGLQPLERDGDATPGVPPSTDLGGRPRRGVDSEVYEKPEAPDGPPA